MAGELSPPTAYPTATSMVFEAVKVRWAARSLDAVITGSVTQHAARDKTAPPYSVIEQVSERVKSRSNCSVYDTVTFKLSVVDLSPELAGGKLAKVIGAFEEPALALNGGELLYLRHSDVGYAKQDGHYEVAFSQFEALVGRPRVRRPA